jgi:hydrogenase expression/formation protein HypD
MLEEGRYEVANQYVRAVRREGSPAARRLIDEVFEIADRKWRGIGMIPNSGYRLRPAYADFDAERRFSVERIEVSESNGKVTIQALRREPAARCFPSGFAVRGRLGGRGWCPDGGPSGPS